MRVYLSDLIGADDNIIFADSAKIIGADFDGIRPQLDGIKAVDAFGISDRGANDACLSVAQSDLSAGDNSGGLIGDDPANRSATGLGKCDYG